MMSSISGFLKVDLYSEIEACLCMSTKSEEEVSTCCSMFVELSLTQNELIHLLSFSIDIYCKFITTKNLWVIEQFAKTIHKLLPYKCKTFNQKIQDENYHILISDLSMLLVVFAKTRKKRRKKDKNKNALNSSHSSHSSIASNASNDSNSLNDPNDSKKSSLLQCISDKIIYNHSKTSLLKEYAAEYEYDNRILLRYSKYFPNVDGCVSDTLLRKICALMYCTRLGDKDVDIVKLLLCELFLPPPFHDNDYLKFSPFPFPDLCHSNQKTNEMVWLIWLGLLNLTKRYFKDLYPQIRYLFIMMQIGFNKKNHEIRIDVLIHIFLNILPGKCFYEADKGVRHKLQRVSAQISNFFYNIHDRVLGQKRTSKRKSKTAQKQEREDVSKSNRPFRGGEEEGEKGGEKEEEEKKSRDNENDSMYEECIPSYMNVIPTRC